jgi:tetratricopeptide (TPR) repeat protein
VAGSDLLFPVGQRLLYLVNEEGGKIAGMTKPASIDYRKWAILIFGMALLVRIIYLLQIKSNPFFSTPIVDELWHLQWAQDILTKSFWGTEVYFRGPLYPYFLALLLKITGSDLFWTRLIQMIISAGSVSLAYLIGREYFTDRVARLGSIFFALYAMTIFYDAMLLIAVIFMFLNLAGLLIVVRNRDHPRRLPYFLAGVVFGLSAIARPNILLVVICLAVWMALRFRKQLKRRPLILLILLFLIGVGLPIAPVTLRNYLVADDLVMISSQGGVNLYLGNNMAAEGLTMMMPEIFLDPSIPVTKFNPTVSKYAEKEMGRPLKASEVSAFWSDKARRFIYEHPGRFLGLTFKKFVYFFSGFENSDQVDIYNFRQYSSLFSILMFDYGLKMPFGLFGPLGLVGMGLCFRRRREFTLPLLFFWAYIPSVVLFLVTARHRLPVIPILVFFAAFAVVFLWDTIRRKDWKKARLPLAAMVILLVLSNINFFDLGFSNTAQIHQNLALTYARQEKYTEAIQEYNLAIREAPMVSALYFGLGTIYHQMGRHEDAVRELSRAVSLSPHYTEAYINLGNALVELGRLDSAEEAFKVAIAQEPDWVEPCAALGDLYMSQNNLSSAGQYYIKALQADPENHIIYTKLGVVYGRAGDTAMAYASFRKSLEIAPAYAPGYVNWGNICLTIGDTAAAIAKYSQAIASDSLLIEPRYNLAVLYMRAGNRAKAVENIEAVLRLQPGFERALELKRRLGG